MRTVRNVHERNVDAPVEVVGALLDRVSSPDDPLSPSPVWPPIRFDGPLAVGAAGGHGFIRYSVGAYEPGRRIRFDFAPPSNGFHALELEPLDGGGCRVRHVLEQKQGLKSSLLWTLVIRPMHDTMIEELFDNVERAATPGALTRPYQWTRRARLMRRLIWDRPVATAPVMTRLRQPERQALDTLIAGGVARSRSEALAWCVRLVQRNADEWLSDLRDSLEHVQQVRAQGPDAE